MREIKKLQTLLLEQGVKLSLPASVVNKILTAAPQHIQAGARGLKKMLDEELFNPIAKIMLAKKTKIITASVNKNKIILK